MMSSHDERPSAKVSPYVGHHDYSIHADMWFKRANVKPDEAAKLLWRLDPLERDEGGNAPDPERIYVDGDKTSPHHYRALLRAFLDVAEMDPKPRTLLDWRDMAKHEGLSYHKWIDEYMSAAGYAEPAGASERPVVTSGSPKPRNKGTPWTDAELQELLRQHQGGATQDALAVAHGVKRQRISVLIGRAAAKFGTNTKTDLASNPLAKLVRFKKG